MKQTSVLIVEDESIIALDIQTQLSSLDYEVVGVVSSGQEAIEAAEEKHPDLILMDIMLKGTIDGIEAADTIHSIVKCPIIFLTAYSDDDTLNRAQVTSPFGYLIKPFSQKDLHAAIQTTLSRQQSESKLERSRDRHKQLATRSVAKVLTANKRLAIETAGRSWAEGELTRQNMLLDCISLAQTRFITDVALSTIYDGLLSNLLLLTNSEYGFIAEVLHDSTGAFYAKTYSISNIAWNKELRETFAKRAAEGLEFHNLETLIGAIITTGNAVISNDPSNDPRSGGLPEGHPSLRAFLGLPIYHGGELVGIAGIANRPEGYDEELISYLDPFLSTCGNLTAAYRNDQSRSQAEVAQQESERRTRALLDADPDLILRIAEDGTYLDCSKSYTDDFWALPSEFLGKTVQEVMPAEVADQTMHLLKQALKTDQIQVFQYSLKMRKELLHFEARIVCSGDNEVVIIIRNITETKRLQELESRAQRLETAGQVAGQVAHDFNNLLGPLIAYPDLIRDELSPDHTALQYLEDMQKSAKQMAEINQQLLTLGRRGYYRQQTLDLNDILRQTIRQIPNLPRDIKLHSKTVGNLKPIMGDSSQISRVILNLIVNAIDAMPTGGQIMMRTENSIVDEISSLWGQIPKGEYVVLTVADTGCGIPSEALPEIFNPFFTSKTADSQHGSGLGLSVVDAVMKDHSGYIDVNSTPNHGTSFLLYFPVTIETPDKPESCEIQHRTETILIVDDDKSQRIVLTRFLEKLGYKVNAKESGEVALNFLKTNQHDLLLLDMVIGPGIDGAETYSRSLHINPKQRAIIISGFADTDRVKAAVRMGVRGFLKKPVTIETLARAVRAELN